MSKQISVATTVLTDPATAASEIDRVLTKMVIESGPAYIGVPADLSHSPIPGEELKTPLSITLPQNDKAVTQKVLAEIRNALEKAAHPIVIVDGSKCPKLNGFASHPDSDL
jgi:pyruvate decarboxylase